MLRSTGSTSGNSSSSQYVSSMSKSSIRLELTAAGRFCYIWLPSSCKVLCLLRGGARAAGHAAK